MHRGGIQALQLLKADKKTIKALEKNLKEEEAFGDWLEKNNPKIAKRLMTKQMEEKKRGKKKIMKTIQEEKEEEADPQQLYRFRGTRCLAYSNKRCWSCSNESISAQDR